MTYPFKILNASTRTSEKFYVEFMGIEENISNVLGRQVYSIDPPNISFDQMNFAMGRNTFNDKGKADHSSVTAVFKDDEDSVVYNVLALQVLKQLKNARSGRAGQSESSTNYKFGMKITMFNSQGQPAGGFILSDCVIYDFKPGEMSYASQQKSYIAVQINFGGFDFIFEDEYLNVLDVDPKKFALPSDR